ncbi:MAG: ATP-dependent helicase [Thermosynechococcaceae cyanobacterium MS004]|nr:ATP-dependent helicase [Thermosynechococcaceae cyanobacterium MS004]
MDGACSRSPLVVLCFPIMPDHPASIRETSLSSDQLSSDQLSSEPLSSGQSRPELASLETKLASLRHSLRSGQREMADWQGGPLAVSAVPGAGKSHGMAAAAAITIANHNFNTNLGRSQQLVLVTFTKSAATHLKQKVRGFLKDLALPQTGFMVQTLHSLALNIATRHPQRSGLDLTQTTLISPYQSHRLIRQCVEQWIQRQPQLYRRLLEVNIRSGEEGERLRRQSALRTDILPALAQVTIHEAKSSGLMPADLLHLADHIPDELPILAIAAGLFTEYNALLRKTGWIDYDDMILGALQVLEDPAILRAWQAQVFAVFEDEAQDSTPLQFKLLELLATDPDQPERLNLIRVGDPNQAINSTFTPADPIYFRQFCQHQQSQALQQSQAFQSSAAMTQSARSCQPIIDAANYLVDWANRRVPVGAALPFEPQVIQPVADGVGNPAPWGRGVELHTPQDIYRTAAQIAERVIAIFRDDPNARVAVLVRENRQARFLADVLSEPKRYGLSVDLTQHDIPIFDVGASDRRSHVPAEMLAMLQFVARPHSPEYFKAVLAILAQRQVIQPYDFNQIANEPEQFLYPSAIAPESLSESSPTQSSAQYTAESISHAPEQNTQLQSIRTICIQLLNARWELPLFRLVSFLAEMLNYDAVELATADKLATRLNQTRLAQRSGEEAAPAATLSATLTALQDIVSTERFDPVDLDNDESQYTRPHQLTLMTMHKAKGLDWDAVFLPFLHANTLPGNLRVPMTAQFLGEYTLSEVARAQIRASLHDIYPLPLAAEAWAQAKQLKTAEEFRLLYVAMTRAKRLLWLSAAQEAPYTWGTFNWERQTQLESQKSCPFLPALKQAFPTAIGRQ